jgi:hypothetical protein
LTGVLGPRAQKVRDQFMHQLMWIDHRLFNILRLFWD